MSLPDQQSPPTPAAAPPAPEPAPAAPAPAAPALGPDGKPWDPQRQQDLIAKLREENREKDAKLAAAQAAEEELAKLRQQQETDEQRRARELAEAQSKAEQAAEQAAASTEALRKGYLLAELAKPEHGIVDAEAAAALITGVEYGEDGRPTNAAEKVAAMLEGRPFLRAVPAAPAAAPNLNGGGGTNPAPAPPLTPEEVAAAKQYGMTPEKYAQWRDAKSIEDFRALSQPQTQ
jgi:multidrug efflux pump subunit AcrA (membrane-fusion protein)